MPITIPLTDVGTTFEHFGGGSDYGGGWILVVNGMVELRMLTGRTLGTANEGPIYTLPPGITPFNMGSRPDFVTGFEIRALDGTLSTPPQQFIASLWEPGLAGLTPTNPFPFQTPGGILNPCPCGTAGESLKVDGSYPSLVAPAVVVDPCTELTFENGDLAFPDGGFLLVDSGGGRAIVYNNAPLYNRTNTSPDNDPAQFFDLEVFNTITSPQLYAKFLLNALGLVKLEGKGSSGTSAIFLDPDATVAPAGIYMSVNNAAHEIRNSLGAAGSKFEVLDHNGSPIFTLTG